MDKRKLNVSKEELEKLYWGEGLSLSEIGQKFNVVGGTILYWMKKYEIPRRKPNKEIYPIPREKLEKLYLEKKLSSREIGKKLNVPSRTIRKKLNKFNISTRSLSEATRQYPKTSFSGDPKEKAYLLALRAGDIHSKRRYETIRVQTTTTHTAQVKMMKESFEKYSHVSVNTFLNKKRKAEQWFIYSDLDRSFEFLLEKPKKIPKYIIENKKLFYPFLAGYMDCEGSWKVMKSHEKHTRFVFSIKTGDLKILEQIKNNIESFGCHPHLYLEKRGNPGSYSDSNKDFYLNRSRRPLPISDI